MRYIPQFGSHVVRAKSAVHTKSLPPGERSVSQQVRMRPSSVGADGRQVGGPKVPYLAAAGGIAAGLRGCAAGRLGNSAGILPRTVASTAAPTDAVGSLVPGMRIAGTGRATAATAALSADGDAALPID